MKDYNEDFPRRSKIVEKGRKDQKFKKIIKQYDFKTVKSNDDEDELLKIDSFNKMSHFRR